ncbi:ThuA domain-containing protein [Sphingomonas sp.]|uniref:ThuA domain-containing protein n=1 Tax=Sphingomonas sp. TaxID=28214 RepID=UPI0025DA01A4|nr:ThuA domain-containing protein [Sphingomonas sp.]
MIRTMLKWSPLVGAAAVALALSAVAGAQGGAVTDANGVPTGAEKPRIPGQNLNGMHVYLRAGLKTHLPGQHDYPQFLADWSKILTQHGAVVDGSFHAPGADELQGVDVIVMYKGDTGFMTAKERADLMAFVKRGGGIVMIHDALCGPDPAEMAMLVGGGKKHGEVNYTLDANVPYHIVDPASPIMKGVKDFALKPEESFYKMTWAESPKIHVLATATIDDTPAARQGGGVGQVVPQIWTYEHALPGGQPARAFVWMQGHEYANLGNPMIENMLLRGIAWAGKHPVDELVDYKQPPAPPRPARQG